MVFSFLLKLAKKTQRERSIFHNKETFLLLYKQIFNAFISFIFSPFIFLKMIILSLKDTCTSSHTDIFLRTVWHPRHLRQLNRELHDHFNPGNSFCWWSSSSLLLPTTLQSIVWIIISLHVVCQTRKHPGKSQLVYPIAPPPTKPFTQCDSHTAGTLQPQPKGGSRTRLEKGKMAFWTEVNVVCTAATTEVATPEPVSSQPTPH